MARTATIQDDHALPEADRLEGFPHPRETRCLFGQEDAERTLLQAFSGGRMHHAWLLCGRAGIGKATLAYRLARHVLARAQERDASSLEVDPETAAARQVAALSHPGLLVLRRPYDLKTKRFATGIPVDEVRRLKSFLGLTAGDDAWRVVIVDSADDLNPNAANALLKSLEEPPRRAVFVLISSEPGSLLPTIRSRCRRLDVRPLGRNDLRKAMQSALDTTGASPPEEREWSQLEQFADGSVRLALQLFAGGGLKDHAAIMALLTGLPKIDWPAAHTLADALASSGSEQRFKTFVELLCDAIGRLVRDRALEAANGASKGTNKAQIVIPAEQIARWAGLWATLVREKTEADLLNLDRKAFVLRTLNRLQQAVDETA
jgi:DNA polymerase-3 subunit delta'